MSSICEYIVYNNVPYSEYKSDIKSKLDKFIKALEKAGLTQEICSEDVSKKFRIDDTAIHTTFIGGGFAHDLKDKMSSIWINCKN